MTNKTTSFRNSKLPKNEELSRNHGKTLRYRLRVKETKEAEDDIKKYKDNNEKYEQGL